jgi:hypothetical protein
MLRFFEFVFVALTEDQTPTNKTDSGVAMYDPRMAFRKVLRRKTWLARKQQKQQAKAKIAEAIKQYQQIKEELYGNH